MHWIYNGKEYFTEPISLIKEGNGVLQTLANDSMNRIEQLIKDYGVVYHKKWNKCYHICSVANAVDILPRLKCVELFDYQHDCN